jgi:Holliday junction DNA helicase RuvA
MIASISGKLIYKSPTEIVIENNGIGYQMFITLNTYTKISALEEARLIAFLYVNTAQDTFRLYGFSEEAERQMFIHLLSVSGVGPSSAIIMLSKLTPAEVQVAIVGANELLLKSVKGIGEKTAKRIILELKDKMLKEGLAPNEISALPMAENKAREEALAALIALGFNKPAIQKVLNQILREQPELSQVDQLIRLALRQLS